MISIIVVNFNHEAGLKRTLHSIAELEDHGYIDLVVIKDGGSTDESRLVFDEFMRYYPSFRTLYDDKIDGSIFKAMNMALEHVNTPYVVMMNSGDCFQKNFRISEFIPMLDHSIDALFFGYSTQNIVRYPVLNFARVTALSFCHQAMIIKSSFRYIEKYTTSADLELVMKIVSSKKFLALNTVMADYEGGGASSSRSFYRSYLLTYFTFKYFGMTTLIFSLIDRTAAKVSRYGKRIQLFFTNE